MITQIAALGVWNWFILGGLLLVVEIVAPGASFLWLAFAAFLTGGLTLVIAWDWQAQGIAFAVLSLVSLALWWKIGRHVRSDSDQPFLNRRAQAFVGRVFTLEKPIVDGLGTLRIDDTIWRIRGPDCLAGSRVKIAKAESGTLVVERAP